MIYVIQNNAMRAWHKFPGILNTQGDLIAIAIELAPGLPVRNAFVQA